METMTIKAVNKAGTGFMAEGKEGWFNISKGVDITFTGLTKGMTILVNADGKWVKGFEKTQGTSHAPDATVPSASKSAPAYDTTTQDRIARGNAANAVLGSARLLDFVKAVTGSESEAIQMTKDLVAEFAGYIATGTFTKVEAK